MAIWTKRRRFTIFLGLLFIINFVSCKESGDIDDEKLIDKEIDSLSDVSRHVALYNVKKIVELVTGVNVYEFNGNETYFANNSLWRGLFQQCGQKPTLSCVKKNVFGYLDQSLSSLDDFPLTDSLVFKRNNYVDTHKYEQKYNEINKDDSSENVVRFIPLKYPGSSEHIGSEESGRSSGRDESPDVSTFEGLTDSLYEKGMKFLRGHDLTLALPDMFGGAVLRVSPEALESSGGALVKLEINPKEGQVEGRLFGKIKEKVKKKLLMAFMALLLVVKMISLKLFFLLPMLIGAGAAKQFLLKTVLFLFPAFAHLFKMCHYYHGLHGGSKYHHHHHKIAHHHHHIRVPVPVHVPHTPHVPHAEYGVPGTGDGFGGGGGGGFGHDSSYSPEYGGGDFGGGHNHRNDYIQNGNELESWGLTSNNYKDSYQPYNSYEDPRLTRSVAAATEPTVYYHPAPVYQPSLQPSPVRYSNNAAKSAINANNIRLQVLTPTASPTATTMLVTYDPFYSPILQRVDNVFTQLGFNEEACRERLVCSMYRNPPRFSPHSNLISNELSRDSQELQKPSVTNSAISRFHRYVEAARKGQDQGDCIRLYPACTVNTE